MRQVSCACMFDANNICEQISALCEANCNMPLREPQHPSRNEGEGRDTQLRDREAWAKQCHVNRGFRPSWRVPSPFPRPNRRRPPRQPSSRPVDTTEDTRQTTVSMRCGTQMAIAGGQARERGRDEPGRAGSTRAERTRTGGRGGRGAGKAATGIEVHLCDLEFDGVLLVAAQVRVRHEIEHVLVGAGRGRHEVQTHLCAQRVRMSSDREGCSAVVHEGQMEAGSGGASHEQRGSQHKQHTTQKDTCTEKVAFFMLTRLIETSSLVATLPSTSHQPSILVCGTETQRRMASSQ